MMRNKNNEKGGGNGKTASGGSAPAVELTGSDECKKNASCNDAQLRMATARAIFEKLTSFDRLSIVNGKIKTIGRERLSDILLMLNLDHRGQKDVLLKRLKNHFRKTMSPSMMPLALNGAKPIDTNRCPFDYVCVVDFEATCDDRRSETEFTPEIIEFPAILVDTRTREIRHEFRRFCRPKLNPKISDFCTRLTGITQATVDQQKGFPEVLDDFNNFLAEHNMGSKHSWIIVTDSQYDMGYFLVHQCQVSGIPLPAFSKKWINIRKTFANFYDCKRLSLVEMLEKLGIEFEGRPHSGLDDARNILTVSLKLFEDGAQLKANEFMDKDNLFNGKRGGGGGGGHVSRQQRQRE